MPEGDTLFRAARTLDQWLAGRTITAARTPRNRGLGHRLVGQTVSAVEAQGKHLLVRFSSGLVLHSHLRMTGSWHTYSAGERWLRPPSQARVVLEAGDRIAVGFNVPVVELLTRSDEAAHPSLANLGPDILAADLELNEIRRRAATRPPDMQIGDVLLDQGVVAGIGNIWRCEALFVHRVHPATTRSSITDDDLDAMVSTASRLMRASASGPARPPRHVHRRAGKPCVRCGRAIASEVMGQFARRAYWCPRCQPAPD